MKRPIDNQTELRDAAKSGRASFDNNGSTIWEWQTEPGVFTRDASDSQIMKLAAADLQLIESPPPAGAGRTWVHDVRTSAAPSAAKRENASPVRRRLIRQD
jgi:hypothetical protein